MLSCYLHQPRTVAQDTLLSCYLHQPRTGAQDTLLSFYLHLAILHPTQPRTTAQDILLSCYLHLAVLLHQLGLQLAHCALHRADKAVLEMAAVFFFVALFSAGLELQEKC